MQYTLINEIYQHITGRFCIFQKVKGGLHSRGPFYNEKKTTKANQREKGNVF